MAVANGFGKVVTSGSVFMYDTGDTVNSYIGEPTTNVLLNTNLDTGWAKGYQDNIIIGDPYPKPAGITSQAVSFTSPNSYGYWYSYGDYAPQADNTTYSVSVWARTVGSDFTITPYTADNNESHRFWMAGKQVIGNGEWQRLTWNNAFTTPSNNDSDSLSFNFGSMSTNQRFWLLAPQLEPKSHVTPFVEGTRSSTQGLLPIVGNSTMDLSSVSFDSNAQFFWDGTDDTLAVNDVFSHKPNLPFSYEIIVYPLGSDSGTDKMLLGKPGWHTGIMYQSGYTWFRTRYGNPAFYDAGSYLLSPGNYYHLTAVYVPETSMKFYVNGVLNGENTSVSSPLTDIGNTLNIGGSSTNYSCYVKIPVAKVYNRALSAAEVQQNYNKYKSRFNLS